MHKVWCLINVKTFLRVYPDIVTLLAQKKGEPREENPLRLITVELLEFTRHIGLEGFGDVAHRMICEIRAIVKVFMAEGDTSWNEQSRLFSESNG